MSMSGRLIRLALSHTHCSVRVFQLCAIDTNNSITVSLLSKKDKGEKTEMVWTRHEDGRRSRSEESDDESDTGEKEERETKDKVEGCVQ